jgi:hypothetical protein
METKKKKIAVEELIEVIETPIEEVAVVQTKEEFSVLKSFTLDKHYQVGEVVLLSDLGVIKELKINKYIK